MRSFFVAIFALGAIVYQTEAHSVKKSQHSHGSSVGISESESDEAHVHETAEFLLVAQVGNKQFYTAHVHTNWLEALEFCYVNGMHLASFDTALEIQTVAEALSNNSVSHDHGTTAENYDHEFYWTSGNDIAEKGQFRWLTVKENLAQSELHKFLNIHNVDEANCVQLHYLNGGTFYYAKCTQRRDDLPLCQDISGVDRSRSSPIFPQGYNQSSEESDSASSADSSSNESHGHGHGLHSHSVESEESHAH